MRQIRGKIGSGVDGESGMEHVSAYSSLAAYYMEPFDTDTRRMNKVANGMFWELSSPSYYPVIEGEAADDLPHHSDQPDRVIKLRGPVAFISRGDMTPEDEAILKDAHDRAHSRLRAKGWI
ncbi:hypothetical protein [Streptomyces agglomeratus]|uniref:hypothetical protein n=1 Tax=Streptomyces agglomeratus TaxID=285458 RepID=UPI0008541C9E|nr:hypothetical protein [Streptomyces agglomeratus]OEJ36228.1 hypothetical protein BGK72_38305 [Streptomyces agglomeratus]